MKNRLLILLAILLIAVAYSLVSLNSSNEPTQEVSPFEHLFSVSDNNKENDLNASKEKNSAPQKDSLKNNKNSSLSANPNELPYDFSVIGIGDLTQGQKPIPLKEVKVLIKYDNELYEHSLNDYLLNTDMQLVNIEAKQITIIFDQVLYLKPLILPNLLSSEFKKVEKSHSELMQMSPEEISTRPRIIEHLVDLTTTPYIADGKLVAPGLNPLLFRQAGFKADDVLKQINGKSVTIESEFEDIKKELKTAHTLKFLVMRKGRNITLYLDIPSEGLELVRD